MLYIYCTYILIYFWYLYLPLLLCVLTYYSNFNGYSRKRYVTETFILLYQHVYLLHYVEHTNKHSIKNTFSSPW